MFGQSRGLALIARHKAEARGRVELIPTVAEKPQAPKLSTIEDAHRKASTLISAMESKKQYWEEQLRIATEELRQAEIVLSGGLQLLAVVEHGMGGVEAPLVHDEIDTTVSSNDTMTSGDFGKFLDSLMTSTQ